VFIQLQFKFKGRSFLVQFLFCPSIPETATFLRRSAILAIASQPALQGTLGGSLVLGVARWLSAPVPAEVAATDLVGQSAEQAKERRSEESWAVDWSEVEKVLRDQGLPPRPIFWAFVLGVCVGPLLDVWVFASRGWSRALFDAEVAFRLFRRAPSRPHSLISNA
jgi:hypothetical protein